MTSAEYKQERRKRSLTQAALAALLGIARETVSRRENGKQQITEEAALALRSIPSSNDEMRDRHPSNSADNKKD